MFTLKKIQTRLLTKAALSLSLIFSSAVFAADPAAAPAADLTRTESATALINQSALNQQAKFNGQYQEFKGVAPGTRSLIDTGKVIADNIDILGDVTKLVDVNMRDSHNKPFLPSTFLQNYTSQTDKSVNLNFADVVSSTKMSKTQADSAQAFIRNVTMPLPSFVSPESRQSDGAAQFGDQLAQHASMSVALHSFYHLFAIRQPKNDTSLLETLERESTWRFVDRDNLWYSTIAASSYEALLREYAQMEAFSLYMDYMNFRQGERTEALLAANVASKVKISSVLAKLVTILNQATAKPPNPS